MSEILQEVQARSFQNGDTVLCPGGKVGLIIDIRAFGQSSVDVDGQMMFFFWKDMVLMKKGRKR